MPGRWAGSWASSASIPAFRQTDDWSEAALDSGRWTGFAFGSVTGAKAASSYDFTVASGGTGGATLSSQVTHDITGDRFPVRLLDAGVQEAGLQAYASEYRIDANNRAFVTVANGFIGTFQTVGGVTTDHGFTAYDPAVHKWFQMRTAANVAYWEYSTDGITYTTLASTSPLPFATTDVLLVVGADTFLSLGTAKLVSFGRVGAL